MGVDFKETVVELAATGRARRDHSGSSGEWTREI
jgi:hypothetical protein